MSEEKKIFKELLREFGSQTKIAHEFGLSNAAITKWKKNGIPKVRMPYFRLAYPNFKVWKEIPSAENDESKDE